MERAIEYVKIEQNNLMTITLRGNLTVIYHMSTTGFNYCIYAQWYKKLSSKISIIHVPCRR